MQFPSTLSLARSTATDLELDLQAFLRIRPAPPGVPLQSYLQVLNETDVLMVPPMVRRVSLGFSAPPRRG